MPPPHSKWQRDLIETRDSVVLLGGGRSGKTDGEIRRMVRAMCLRPGLYWWVGLSRKSASYKKAWRALYLLWSRAFRQAGLDPREWINKSDHEIRTPAGATLMFRTAENPQSIAGDGPLGVIGDEFTYWSAEVWERFVRPALLDHHAWCHLIGRPHGENWGFDLWRRAASMPGWQQVHKTVYDNPLLDVAEIDAIKASTPPAVFAQEYMAEPGSGDDGVIPLVWVLAAVERWKAAPMVGQGDPRPLILGIDVSEGGGGDRTIFAWRYGWRIDRLTDETPRMQGEMLGPSDTAAKALAGAPAKSYAIVDNVGVGAGVPTNIRRRAAELGKTVLVIGFKAGRTTKLRDGSGQFGFNNIRSAAWWHLRELLNPENGTPIELPDDRDLIAELTAPHYDTVAGAKIAIEEKKFIRARIGRSTDKADPVIQAFWDKQIMQ